MKNIDNEFSIKLQELTADTDMTDVQFIKLLEFIESHYAPIIAEAERNTLDAVAKRWNNFIGDMPDEKKEKLGYLELTGMLWGILAAMQDLTQTQKGGE